VLLRVVELSSFGFLASDRIKETAIQNVVLSLLRLIGIVFLVMTMKSVTLISWAQAYITASFVGMIYALVRGAQLWGKPRVLLPHLQANLLEGLYFSVGVAAATIYNDIDKIMLARLSDLTSTGIYGAAYRIIDVSMSPIRSLVFAANPKFFEKGILGIRANYIYARRLISRSMLGGIAIGFALWAAAPILPLLLGTSYRSAVPALRMLAAIPFLRSIHAFLADALSGAGYQAIRMVMQVGIALLNIGLNILILPRWSWRGAAWTSVVCDGALVIALWLTIQWSCRSESRIPVVAGVTDGVV
jgi:O-antigen/teichoic acid export membrane protein